ncbi:MAG: hypothetical protein U0869_00205 [Chloroflexota bacterium]
MSDPNRPEPVSGTVESGGFRSWSARSVGGDSGPEWHTFEWTSSRPGWSWLGILLVVLGVALVIMQLLPGVTFTSLLLTGLGVGFLAAWLMGHWKGATIPALVLLAWGGTRIAAELGYLTGDGWTPLAVGVALILAWGIGQLQQVRREWSLWVGVALVVFGLAQVTDVLSGGWDLLWPLALVALGAILIVRRRPGRSF